MCEPLELPRLASDLPGCGGSIKTTPEDFQVIERAAYSPSGEGEHLFLWVEKRDVSTPEVARQLAEGLKLPQREVSYAGLKDRFAITQQFFCVPARVEALVQTLALPQAKILWWKRHRQKLRTGHLAKNWFRIRIRGADASRASDALNRLRQTGVPNYFGTQRFGQRGDNAQIGKRLLMDERPLDFARGERLAVGRFERRLFLSAYQSHLFNRALENRIAKGTFGRALVGDVMRKSDTGGVFVCENALEDQARMDRFELSPAGPLFGPKMIQAKGEVAAQEAELLKSERLRLDDFRRGFGETKGGRRAYRISLGEVGLREEGGGLWLDFELPKGSYATVLLREVMGQGPSELNEVPDA